jgi:hypothetical protein
LCFLWPLLAGCYLFPEPDAISLSTVAPFEVGPKSRLEKAPVAGTGVSAVGLEDSPSISEVRGQRSEVSRWPGRYAGLLVSLADEQLYRRFLPKGDTPLLRSLPHADLIWYDRTSTPEIYQVFDRGGDSGTRRSDRHASINNEFPWAFPAGAVRASNFKTLRFVKDLGMDWWRDIRPNGTLRGYRWQYRPGTLFGEIILVTGPDGTDYPAILRTRQFRDNGTVRVNQYAPYPERKDLEAALEREGLTLPALIAVKRVLSSGHQQGGFQDSASMDVLPAIPPAIVARLLGSAFLPVGAKVWATTRDGVTVTAPTANDFSIVPKGWLGAFVPLDAESCRRCHQDTNKTIAQSASESGEQRWRVRGDGGIFSFHPLEANPGSTMRLNAKLVNAGLIRHKEGMP